MTAATLYYVHDPMCSWCWGHRPEWQVLQDNLPSGVQVKNITGGLAPDSDEPMPKDQQTAIASYWKKIESLLGTEFNHDFWQENTPRRSTYPACRAVIAARWQNAEEAMIYALQEAYYLKAMNPSDTATHLILAEQLGLDVDKFATDIQSPALEKAFIEELQFARSLPINGFPSMVLEYQGNVHVIPLDYQDHRGAISTISSIIA